ncbi:MAG: CBS domain-containing protein [Candidatus Izemoplasmatales bacterium]|jgi:CBS domain-containing protein|nr:CBS domain-containing protein [Candidatus Izemoplasmatales bacterium]MDD4069029.1 CBS domain-containing protein [Candidatus Izemoplasmatales bacterium]
MIKEKDFLKLFNELEEYLRIKYQNKDYSYTGFVTKLYQIKKSKENSIINNNYNFDIIKQAAQMRNIIAHNNDVLVPSDRFMKEFETIVNKITKPLTVRQIMTKYQDLKTIHLNTTIGDVVDLLKNTGYSTIPVIERDDLIGIFTEKSLYDYFSLKKTNTITKSMRISEIIEAIDLNNHPRKYFEFISKDSDIYQAYHVFNKDIKQRRELLLLLVTENGKQGEHLLGIVALRDLENHLIN